MVNAPDADILREIIELLKARVATGAATFLIKKGQSTPRRTPKQAGENACRGSARSRQGKQGVERQDGSDGVPMGRRERHKKISLEEKEKNLASHNRNVSMWKVATQDQEEANKRVATTEEPVGPAPAPAP